VPILQVYCQKTRIKKISSPLNSFGFTTWTYFNVWIKWTVPNVLVYCSKIRIKQISSPLNSYYFTEGLYMESVDWTNSRNSKTVQFTTSSILPQQTARKEQARIWWNQSYLACALETAFVNASKPSFSQEALGPEVPGGCGKLAEGESLRRDNIAIGILWRRSLSRERITLDPRFLSRCTT